jgi:hypothetical protein
LDANSGCGGLTFKTELGLNGFSASEANLMNHSELATSSITKDGASAKLLCRESIPPSRELATEEGGLILVRKNQVPGFELIQFENAGGPLDESRACFGRPLLFAKLAGGTFRGVDGSGPHLDAQLPKEPTPADPLGVLPPQMAPFGMPEKKALLERGEIGVGGLSEAFESKRLGCSKNVVKPPNDGKGRLTMVPDGNLVAVSKLEIGFVPL